MQYKTGGEGKTIRKVQFASWTAAASSVILYLLKQQFFAETPLPDPIELALGLVVSGAVSGIATWAAGYLARPRKRDTVVPDTGQPPPLESVV